MDKWQLVECVWCHRTSSDGFSGIDLAIDLFTSQFISICRSPHFSLIFLFIFIYIEQCLGIRCHIITCLSFKGTINHPISLNYSSSYHFVYSFFISSYYNGELLTYILYDTYFLVSWLSSIEKQTGNEKHTLHWHWLVMRNWIEVYIGQDHHVANRCKYQ